MNTSIKFNILKGTVVIKEGKTVQVHRDWMNKLFSQNLKTKQ